MRISLFSFVLLLFFAACKKDTVASTPTPACITAKVDTFKAIMPVCNDLRVSEYVFQGKTVYMFYLESCCCDQTSEVFDTECTSLGFLGGLIGNTEINGVNFLDNATFVKDIWKP